MTHPSIERENAMWQRTPSHDLIRTVRFRPYLKGKGPSFGLSLYDTNRTGDYGRSILAYRLTMCMPDRSTVLVFSAADFSPAPHLAIDSDECVRSLMAFLTLRPGDTDAEYFEGYDDVQMAFAEEHGEALAMECMHRFGEDS